MARSEIDLKPVSHITSDAIGVPGQRVFYIQAWQEARPQPITIIVEKMQLQQLVIGVEKLIADLENEKPELEPAATDYEQDNMRILPPVDPLFRAGEIGLGYDDESDLVILLIREILAEDATIDDSSLARFWCSRTQIRRMTRWSQEVINRGRPICPQCRQPIDTGGHFCPKKNGNKH